MFGRLSNRSRVALEARRSFMTGAQNDKLGRLGVVAAAGCTSVVGLGAFFFGPQDKHGQFASTQQSKGNQNASTTAKSKSMERMEEAACMFRSF